MATHHSLFSISGTVGDGYWFLDFIDLFKCEINNPLTQINTLRLHAIYDLTHRKINITDISGTFIKDVHAERA